VAETLLKSLPLFSPGVLARRERPCPSLYQPRPVASTALDRVAHCRYPDRRFKLNLHCRNNAGRQVRFLPLRAVLLPRHGNGGGAVLLTPDDRYIGLALAMTSSLAIGMRFVLCLDKRVAAIDR
jgi:hypothetical protein